MRANSSLAFACVFRALRLVGAVVILLVSVTGIHAQPASQITPPTFRPPAETAPSGGLVVPETPGLETPSGAERLFVTLGAVTVDGAFPEMTDEGRALAARLAAGKPVSGAELFAAARDLEAAYARAGFVLARVVLPPQELRDGATLRLIVVDGFIEKAEADNVPARVRQRIIAQVEPLIGKRHLRLGDIERRLLLAGDTPGVLLRSTLAPGSTTGGSVLALQATHQPVGGLVSLDNTLAQALGTWTLGAGFDLNSVLGLGELVYFRAMGHPGGGSNGFFGSSPLSRTLAGGIVLPIGIDGFTLNVEATQARTYPISNVIAVSTADWFERLSIRARYPWLRSRRSNLAVGAALDIENETQPITFAGIATNLSEDRLRVLRFSAEGDHQTTSSALASGRIVASFGVDGLGARTAAEAAASGVPLSRQGADAAFSKIEGQINLSQPTGLELVALNLGARGQYSFGQALLHAEQIGIASPTGLSAFDAGALQGDSGFVLRGELTRAFTLPTLFDKVGLVASPYLYAAWGEVFLQAPTAVEASSISAGSFGVGLRLNDGVRNSIAAGGLTLEIGFTERSDGMPTSTRAVLLMVQRF